MSGSRDQEAARQRSRNLHQQQDSERGSASRKHKQPFRSSEQELQGAQAAQAVRAVQREQQQSQNQQQRPQQQQGHHQQPQYQQPHPQNHQERFLAAPAGNFHTVNAQRRAQGQQELTLNAYCRMMRIPTATIGPRPTFNDVQWQENRRDRKIERSVSPRTRADGDVPMEEEERRLRTTTGIEIGKKGSDGRRRGDDCANGSKGPDGSVSMGRKKAA